MAEVVYQSASDTVSFARWLDGTSRDKAVGASPLAAARISFADAVPLQERCRPAVEGVLAALASGDVVLLARDGRDLRLALHCLAQNALPAASSGSVGTAADDERPQLTKREIEALTLAAKGLSAQEVATMLDVSIHTANSHFKNAYRKLKVRSRAEAVFEATRLGVILR